jgi:uncharacterized membrane protein
MGNLQPTRRQLEVLRAFGAVVGAGVGKIAHRKVESGIERQAEETIPIGGAGLIVVYEPKHADVIEAAVKRAIKQVVGEATDSHVKAVKAALSDASAKMAAGGT